MLPKIDKLFVGLEVCTMKFSNEQCSNLERIVLSILPTVKLFEFNNPETSNTLSFQNQLSINI